MLIAYIVIFSIERPYSSPQSCWHTFWIHKLNTHTTKIKEKDFEERRKKKEKIKNRESKVFSSNIDVGITAGKPPAKLLPSSLSGDHCNTMPPPPSIQNPATHSERKPTSPLLHRWNSLAAFLHVGTNNQKTKSFRSVSNFTHNDHDKVYSKEGKL